MIRNPNRGFMKLGGFFHPTGNHVASWLSPDAQADAGQNIQHYVELAQMAEWAKFDMMFLADAVATRDGNIEALSRWPQYMAYFEPITLLSALAMVTTHLGLAATATTSYNEPYNLARKFASLDQISNGRAGWNIVTSSNTSEAWNFGRENHYEHGERYDRALEFVDVVRGLWDSWDDDAFVRDRSTARYFVPERLHFLHHKGEHFSVRGPLNVARSAQGHPVLFQASASEAGKTMAARLANGMFTTLLSLPQAQAFYQDVKGRLAAYGRSPEDLKILPGVSPIVGRTQREAAEKFECLTRLIHPDVGLEVLSNAVGGYDLSGCDLDGPLPREVHELCGPTASISFRNVLRWSRDENLTIRQLYQRFGGARGQRIIIGTPESLADEMEAWFVSHGCDGFLIQPSTQPGGFREFTEMVVPVLQERGLFRKEYEGSTLRENLGLPRPVSRYSAGS